jgi:hypothetical protein
MEAALETMENTERESLTKDLATSETAITK